MVKGKYLWLTCAIICLFLLFAASMTIYLMHREERQHVELLQTRLQSCNDGAYQLHQFRTDSVGWISPSPDIRLTVIDLKGDVIYDSTDTIAHQPHANHLDREEIRQALQGGRGYALIRSSETTGRDYFYSATRYGDCVVRSALPYDTELRQSLATDRHYLTCAVLITLALLALFLYMTRRMGKTETANVELQTKLQLEQQYSEYKHQLSHNIAHELKTPVASIQGYLETIQEVLRGAADGDRQAQGAIDLQQLSHFIDRSFSQAQRLNALVQDISTLNRMSESRSLEREVVDVAALVRGITDEVALKLELQQMTVQNLLPHRLPLECNASLVYSIFRNLIDNSIAYAGRGTTITLATDGAGSFRYYDNGPGIPDEHLPRIFERFYRIDQGRSRRQGGTGLGLAIVRNAVALHGGTITARNRAEGGLEFSFTLRSSFVNHD